MKYALEFDVEIEDGMSECDLEDRLRDALQDADIEVGEYVYIRELED